MPAPPRGGPRSSRNSFNVWRDIRRASSTSDVRLRAWFHSCSQFGLVSLEAFAFRTQRRRLRLLLFVLACQVGVLRVDRALLRLDCRSSRLQIAMFLRQPCRNGRRAGKPLVERRFLGALFRKFFLLALGRLPYFRNPGSGLRLFAAGGFAGQRCTFAIARVPRPARCRAASACSRSPLISVWQRVSSSPSRPARRAPDRARTSRRPADFPASTCCSVISSSPNSASLRDCFDAR